MLELFSQVGDKEIQRLVDKWAICDDSLDDIQTYYIHTYYDKLQRETTTYKASQLR